MRQGSYVLLLPPSMKHKFGKFSGNNTATAPVLMSSDAVFFLPDSYPSLLPRNALSDQARTNEGCCVYSEKLVELCKEMDVEAINLWTAIQETNDWADSCFM